MPVFTHQFGRLPQALVDTAISFNKKADIADQTENPPEGFRFCFISYNIPSTAKTTDVLPKNFAVQVPISPDVSTETWEMFTNALALDYQDSIIKKVANPDGILSLDPTDWIAVIADYYDETRKRNGFVQKDIIEWYQGEWIAAYMIRTKQRNAETPENGKITKEMQQKVIGKYLEYMKKIAKKECFLSETIIHGVRQSTEKLLQYGLLKSNDKIARFIIEQCNVHTNREALPDEETIASV